MNATDKPKPGPKPGGGAPEAVEIPSAHLGTRLRGYFLTGLIVAGPVVINLVDAWVKPLIPKAYLPENYLPFTVPGVGLIFAVIGLMVIGALTANLFGRSLSTMASGCLPACRSCAACIGP